MKKLLLAVLIFLILPTLYAFTIVENGVPKAQIVLTNPTEIDNYAAKELVKYVKEISGATLSITNTASADTNNILIGQNATETVLENFDWEKLGYDGIVIETKRNNLCLAGNKSGTIYAVYTLLEDYFGVKYLSPQEEYIPQNQTLTLGKVDYKHVSPYILRETNWTNNNYNVEYALKLKVNGQYSPIPPELGGRINKTYFCHTFNILMNPDVYGKDHPDWFAERVGGRLVSHLSQPCLTNQAMVEEFIKNTLIAMAENPNDKIISITQNDNQNFCECPTCKAFTDKHGQSGLMVHFANQVGDAVKKVYPDKYVETFAYQYTRHAPTNIGNNDDDVVPHDNVIIQLCSIECDFSHPFDAPINKDFYKDLKDWKKISKQLCIWDYTCNYADHVMVHPNIQVLQPNMQICAKNNAKFMFAEGDYCSDNSCLNLYKRYIISRLMWDPDLDFEKETMSILNAYYGPGAKEIYNFMKVIEKPALRDPNLKIRTFMHNCNYFTAEDWIDGFSCFARGLRDTKGTKYFDRVYADMICFYAGYSIEPQAKKDIVEKSGVTPFKSTKEFIDKLAEFGPDHGLNYYAEGRPMSIGLYAIPTWTKTAKAPKECEGLKDNEWIDIPGNKVARVYHNNTYAMSGSDPKAAHGKVTWMCPKFKLKYVQVPLSNYYFDETIKTGDVYVSYKVVPGNKEGVGFLAGCTNEFKGELYTAEFSSNDTPDGEYVTRKLGTIDFKNTTPNTYIWFGGSGDGETSAGMYIDRVFVVLHR